MADTKITALTAISVVNPATYPLPIVDTSDTTMAGSGTTKKVTVNQILGSGGTATLASATITGDLTVDTSTLKVDSANNRVGIINASPGVALHIGTTGGTNKFAINTAFTSGGDIQLRRGAFIGFSNAADSGNSEYLFANAGALDFGIGGSTAMTLNSTGLGVGITSPSYRLEVRDTADAVIALVKTGANSLRFLSTSSGGVINQVDNNPLAFYTNNTERARIDSSGNFGLGVTPSAWNWAGIKALEIGYVGNGFLSWASSETYLLSNTYYNTGFKYGTAVGASYYKQLQGVHSWHTNSNSPSAGGSATFTQAMTLTDAGELLVGTASAGGVFDTKFYLSSNSGTNKWAVGPYGTATNFAIIPTPGTGGVYLSGTSATSWTAYSDERLKDIIEPITNALTKVGSLRSVIGKFKGDEANTRRPFIIAQDLQSALPEAVDASNPDRLGVAYTDVIPLLVAAIKELTARVQTLETR